MGILLIMSIFVIVFCTMSITDELHKLRFEIRNLKDYIGRDGIIGELKKLRELLGADDGKISTT